MRTRIELVFVKIEMLILNKLNVKYRKRGLNHHCLILIRYLASARTEMFKSQSMLILHHQSSKPLEIL